MRNILFTTAIITLALSTGAFAQQNSVTIVPDKVVYQRTGKNVPDFKKTFEVTYPKISGVRNARVKTNLLATLSYWKTFGTTLDENQGEYHWLTSLSYKVNYNKNSILDIDLIMQGAGAYPDGTVKTIVADLRTGRRTFVADAFTNIGQLLVKIDKAQKREIKKAVAESKRNRKQQGFNALEGLLKRGDYSLDQLDQFSVSDKGVTFIYDYGFPHAVQALEPEGRYFFTWAQISPHIKQNGVLRRFAK